MAIKVNGQIKTMVKVLLTDYKHLRDSDERLIANIWTYEVGGKDKLKKMNGLDLLMFVADGRLTPSDSITRVRRKLQEEYEHLRGESYVARQNNQAKIKKQLK
jgi:hypothetical protein